MTRPATRRLTLAYDRREVVRDLDVEIPDRSFTVIIGANGCGKSTLLRALARVLKPARGTVLLDGKAISEYPSRQVARVIGLLPQSPITPDGITVAELVSRGRFPHQGALRRESAEDRAVIERCLAETGLTELNQAARYASHLIALRDGEVIAAGPPDRVITVDLVERAFGLRARIIEDPESRTPLVIPAFRPAALPSEVTGK